MTAEKAEKRTPRQSNVELLRIVAMLGVVILHYNSVGGGFDNVPAGGASMCLLYGLEGLFICCVNLFVLITGYFSCIDNRRRFSKALGLMLQVAVFQLLGYAVGLMQAEEFSLRTLVLKLVPNNYFVTLYVALYLLSPYMNLVLQKLSGGQLKRLLVLSLVLFALWPTVTESGDALLREDFPGLSTVSLDGSISGYSIVNFALMYLVGASVRLLDIRVKKRYSGAVLVLTAVILSLWGYFDNVTGMARAYCNPLVILEAVAAFLLVRELNFSSRLVNALSPAAFTCFLLHSTLLEFYGIPEAVRQPAVLVLAHVLFTAITIYLIAWLAYRAYHFVSKPILTTADKLLPEMDLDAKQEETQ